MQIFQSKSNNEFGPIDRQIGKRMQIFREDHGITRAELAANLDVECSEQEIAAFESGESPVSVSCLRQIADILYTPFYCFFDDNLFNEWMSDRQFFTSYSLISPRAQMSVRQLVIGIADDRAIWEEG